MKTIGTQIQLTRESLIKDQKLDPNLAVVRNWLNKGARPQGQKNAKVAPHVGGTCYVFGMIYSIESCRETSYQVILPKPCVPEVLTELHNSHW